MRVTFVDSERGRLGTSVVLETTGVRGEEVLALALGGMTLGWHLTHTAKDELFAAIEGSAFPTRIVLERMAEGGVPIERIVNNAGGIPQRNRVLNQVYANVLNKPVLVPRSTPTSIFAQRAAGIFPSIEEAQQKMRPDYETYLPDPNAAAVYEELFALYRQVYFGFGDPAAAPQSFSGVLH